MQSTSQLSRFLQHHIYTGYNLTTAGLEYLHKFDNFEIDSLQMLQNPDYWVKSMLYPLEIITREEWIGVKERLRIYRENYKVAAHRRAEKSIGTGIITCGYCGIKYFYQLQAVKLKGEKKEYYYYSHHQSLLKKCEKSKKTIPQEKIDTILKVFVLYHAITSDGGNKFLKDRLFQEEIEKKAIKEKLNVLKNDRRKTETQINKFRTALETTNDVGAITIIAKQIDSTEKILNKIDAEIVDTEIEMEEKEGNIEKTKSQLMYYSVKDLLKQFFEKWNIEDQRNHLLRVIDNAILTDNILKIKTEEFKFIFDINKKYSFPDDIYKEVLEDVGNDIDMESLKMKNGENVFNQFMWTVLAESMIKGICVYKEKTIKFI